MRGESKPHTARYQPALLRSDSVSPIFPAFLSLPPSFPCSTILFLNVDHNAWQAPAGAHSLDRQRLPFAYGMTRCSSRRGKDRPIIVAAKASNAVGGYTIVGNSRLLWSDETRGQGGLGGGG